MSLDAPLRHYVGIRAAAETTNLSKTHLLSVIHSGRLRGYRVGRRILVDQQELNDFITSIPA